MASDSRSAGLRWCTATSLACLLVFSRSSVDAARILSSSLAAKSSGGSISCPLGLELKSAEEELCVYNGKVPPLSPRPDVPESTWGEGSSAPIYFFQEGGINLEVQLVAELSSAASGSLALGVMDGILTLEAQRNVTARAHIAELQHQLHTMEANLLPGFTATEHALQHVALESLIGGLHSLSHAAELGHIVGGEALVAVLDTSVAGLHLFGEALVSPFILAPTAAYMVWQLSEHYRLKQEHSTHFSTALAVKSRCMREKALLKPEVALKLLKPQVADMCGEEVFALVANQTVRTNAAMHELFERTEEVGRCLFPAGSRSWSKTNCAEGLFAPLRSEHGRNGLLFEALAVVESYGRQADHFFTRPIYSKWFELEFGVMAAPPNASETGYAQFAALAAANIEARSFGCTTLLSFDRAYERMFMRLKVALGVYMQTFARDISHTSMRTSWYPCRRVAEKLEAPLDNGDGFCKDPSPLGGANETEGSELMWEAMHVHVGLNSSACLGDGQALWSALDEHGLVHHGQHEGSHGDGKHHSSKLAIAAAAKDAPTGAPNDDPTTEPISEPAHADSDSEVQGTLCCSCPVAVGFVDNRAECESLCNNGQTTCNFGEAAYCVAMSCELATNTTNVTAFVGNSEEQGELQDAVADIAADLAGDYHGHTGEEQLGLATELAEASELLRDVVAESESDSEAQESF